MTTLLLARHGETDWNRELRIQGSSDIELNARARAGPRARPELEPVELDAIYASDLQPRPATAEAVAAQPRPRRAARSTAARALVRLLGRAHARRHRRRFRRLDHDGETDDEVRERVLEAVQAIATRHPGEQVLVVSHGGALNSLWHHALAFGRALGELCGLQAGRSGRIFVSRLSARGGLHEQVQGRADRGRALRRRVPGGRPDCVLLDRGRAAHRAQRPHPRAAAERRLPPLLEPLRRARARLAAARSRRGRPRRHVLGDDDS